MEIKAIKEVLQQYEWNPGNLEFQKFGSGHIHNTYLVNWDDQKYILQQFNDNVFKFPDRISSNQQVLLSNLNKGDLPFELPLPIKNKQNEFFTFYKGQLLRLFPFIEGVTKDAVSKFEEASRAAEAFSFFIKVFFDVPAEQLQDTIPDFHNLDLRFRQFEQSISQRKIILGQEERSLIDFYLGQKELVDQFNLYRKSLPKRVTHNDTKINNLIFKEDLSRVNALIDLDTIMAGYLFYDFGDLVRTVACTEDESSRNWENIKVDLYKYKALMEGFYGPLKNKATDKEYESLPYGGEMMTCIMGLRFLTDFLNGNIYYQISYPRQNFDRSKNQSCLLKSLQENRRKIQEMAIKSNEMVN